MKTLPLLLAASLLGVPAAGTQAPPGPDVVVDPPLTRPGAAYPVEQLLFPQATGDGAIVDEGDGRFRMAADVMFAFDRAELTPRAVDEIARMAQALQAVRGADLRTVDVVGHTDATGDATYNLTLSQQRAEAVRAVLATDLGPGVEVRATGRGEAEPIADNATAEGQALNRRVEIVAG